MDDGQELAKTLDRIDRRGYKAYRDIRGSWTLSDFTLHIDHVQGDPFAAPSRIRVRVPASVACFPQSFFSAGVRKIALGDWLARRTRSSIGELGRNHSGSGGSGRIEIDAGGQEVLERSAILVTPDWVEARLSVGLPAAGRRVLGPEAKELLLGRLPALVEQSLVFSNLPEAEIRQFIDAVENQEAIRAQLRDRGLIAFVGDGSVLPRQDGASDLPLPGNRAVPFESPPEFSVRFEVPNAVDPADASKKTVSGMGIPKGITLIVGGGYHGKSTLLRALERGIHPHVPGDGREWVVSSCDLVKIRAEDGRAVTGVDVSGFIGSLPGEAGASTPRCFSTGDASGSTSQAANISEAIEAGCNGLLLDEDTSATNFMIRDARMQALIASPDEPITPFLDRVRELYECQGVSVVIVMGGSGDYFDVADHVIAMREYASLDVTTEARRIASDHPSQRRRESTEPLARVASRVPDPGSFDASRGRRDVKIDARGRDKIVYGRDEIDLRALEQLLDPSQTRAIGRAIYWGSQHLVDGLKNLREILDALDARLDEEGLDLLASGTQRGHHPGALARPRRYEIASAINRLRRLQLLD